MIRLKQLIVLVLLLGLAAAPARRTVCRFDKPLYGESIGEFDGKEIDPQLAELGASPWNAAHVRGGRLVAWRLLNERPARSLGRRLAARSPRPPPSLAS